MRHQIARCLLAVLPALHVLAAGGCGPGGGKNGDGGVVTDPKGPRILSVAANVTTLTERDTLIITVVATDPDGIDDLIGGAVVSPSGATYGALASAAAEGSYSLTLTWAQINTVAAIDAGTAGAARAFQVQLFDAGGHKTTADLTVTLKCSDATRSACGGQCWALTTDRAHCGQSCATAQACPAALVCANGACGCSGSGRLCPGNVCLDTTGDEANCGACGRACTAAQTCTASNCVSLCAGTLTYCPDEASCIDTRTNRDNCGACGRACPAGQTCSASTCGTTCPTGQMYCPDPGVCANLTNDPLHCGSCDNTCLADEDCVSSQCEEAP